MGLARKLNGLDQTSSAINPEPTAAVRLDDKVSVFWKRYWVELSLLLLAFVSHCPSLVSGFVWDDISFMEKWLPRFNSLGDIFFPPPNIPLWPYHYYRPIGVLSLKVESLLFGEQFPLGFHITNILLHSTVCLLVYKLFKQVLRNDDRHIAAVSGAVLFAIHPIHVESVNWIAGRSDVLAVLFCLLTILFSLRYLKDGHVGYLAFATTSLFIGLLCKEVAVCAVPLFVSLAYFMAFDEPSTTTRPTMLASIRGFNMKNARIRHSCYAVSGQALAIVLYFMLRFYSGAPSRGGQNSSSNPFEQLDTVIQASAYYLGQMFLWQPQVTQPPHWFMPSLFVSIIVLLTLAVGLIATKLKSDNGNPVWIGFAWFAFSLAPSLAVITQRTDSNFLSERYLYLPSIGFCLIVGWIFERIWNRAQQNKLQMRAVALASFVVVAFLVHANIAYGMAWTSQERMWNYVLQVVPDHANAFVNLSEAFDRRKDYQQSLVYSRKAMEVAQDPKLKAGLCARFACQAREQQLWEESEAAAKLATQLDPMMSDGWLQLGLVYFEQEQFDLAAQQFRKAVQCDPHCSNAYVNLAKMADNEEEAVTLLFKALEANPWNEMAYNNLGVLHAKKGRVALARTCLRKALEIEPEFEMARNNLTLLSESQ